MSYELSGVASQQSGHSHIRSSALYIVIVDGS
jgi:hypothetical protein